MTATAECHISGGQFSGTVAPWSGDRRADAKDKLFGFATENPEGVPIISAVRAVLNADATAGDADHRLALRYFENYPDWFKTARRDGFVWVEPRPDAFTCTANKHGPKPTECGGETDDIPKQNARNALARRRTIESDDTRTYLLNALATYRETTEGRYLAFEDTFNPGNYRLVPYSTRFNDSGRVSDAKKRFREAFDRAANQHQSGVVVTLTTDPKQFESVLDAIESLLDDVNRFKSWIATDTHHGTRPPSIVVPEITDSGLPHVHIALFGVTWVVAHPALSAYWGASRERGEVVWFDRIESDGQRWEWAGRQRAQVERERREMRTVNSRSPREYLSKTLDTLTNLASASPESVRNAARDESETGEWWKLAVYWATGTRLFTLSPSLKPSTENDNKLQLPADAPARWRYIGTARYEEFPSHVRANADVLKRTENSF